jgi:hypothetical protein
MKRVLVACSVIAACLATVAARAHATPDGAAATRLVDRTLTCRVGYFHGARLVYLTVGSASRNGETLSSFAQAYVSTAGNPLSRQDPRPTLAGVTAGWPPPPPFTTGGLGYDNGRCGPSRAKVPLTPRGLSGGIASSPGGDVQCIVAKTVLVRVRGTFRDPVEEEPNKDGTYITALGRLVSGQVAVRSLTGKPIAYADVVERGRARLFTKAGCV